MIPEALRHHRKNVPAVGNARDARGLLLRGVVVATYRPDDLDSRGDRDESEVKGIFCDVLVVDPLYRGRLSQVPVLAQSAGVNDYEQWVPKAVTANIKGEKLTEDGGSAPSTTTDITNTDGDYVLIGFMGNDLAKPVILGQLPHKLTKRRPSANDATLYKWRRHIRGVLVGITESGGVEIDLSESSTGAIDGDGVESQNGDATLTIRTKGGGEVTVSDDGAVVFTLGAAGSVEVNGGGVVEKSLKAETFLSLLSGVLVDLTAAYGAAVGGPAGGVVAMESAISGGTLESDKLQHD